MKRGLSTGDIARTTQDIGDDTDGGGVYTQVRGRRKKVKKANEKVLTQTDVPASVTANSPLHPGPSTSVTAVANGDDVSQLQKTVEQLSCIVHAQQATINSLMHKLKFVLSFLDISDNDQKTDNLGRASDIASQVDISSSSSNVAANHGSAEGSTEQDSRRVDAVNTVTTYADIAAASRVQVTTQPSNFREAVAEAMYVDQRARERRAKSVVVSGLQPSVGVSDEVAFRQLCSVELSVDPMISFTRRLGAAAGDRVRLLLVGLRSAEDVAALVTRAKELRQSTTESVRRNVFINRNMTKVEARLAYEERCRRRRRQHIGGQAATPHRRDEQHQLSTVSQPCSDNIRSGDSSTVVRTSQSADVSMSPAAPEFIPAAAVAAGRHRC